ncbi:MAG: hypothetical protein FWD00_03285, partial [Clostridiales bacterium]|nr:hypothetical protein [Clostridiales bacterium]
MIYEKNIPDFALMPAREPEKPDDGFDPSPYDRILNTGFKSNRNEEIPAAEAVEEQATEASTETNEMGDETAEIEAADDGTAEVETVMAEAEGLPEIEAIGAQSEESVQPQQSDAQSDANMQPEEVSMEPEQKPIVVEPAPKAQPPIQGKREAAKIIPLTGSVLCSNLKITDIKEPPRTRVFIEEDILVPDIKPDLKSILSMDGSSKLADKEILVGANGEDTLKVIGEITLQTIYIPDRTADEQEQIVTIQSRIPFKSDWGVSVSPLSHVAVKPVIESIDYTVINERKIRAKIAMFLTLREYSDIDVEIFEEIRGEDLQLLKEKIRLTDVAVRKTDVMELQESMPLKDNTLLPHKILRYNINIVE